MSWCAGWTCLPTSGVQARQYQSADGDTIDLFLTMDEQDEQWTTEPVPLPLEQTHPELAEHFRLIVAGQHPVRSVQVEIGRRIYRMRTGQVVCGALPDRNSPCPCGSGVKWKKCHGR